MRLRKWILLVEDEYMEVQDLTEVLRDRFPSFEIETIETECEFRTALDRIAASPPAAAVIDLMLPWQEPTPDDSRVPMPLDVAEEGGERAGLRCQRLMAERVGTGKVPVILYSHLPEKILDEILGSLNIGITCLGKSSDYMELIVKLQEILHQ